MNTVRGPVEASDLGSTLMHEHVFVLSPEIEKTSAEWDEQAAQDTAVQRLPSSRTTASTPSST